MVGLVGFGGLWTANRAPKNWLSGQRGERGRAGLGAQTGVAGGTSGPNWGHIRPPRVGSVGFRGCFGLLARGKPPCGRPLPWGIPTWVVA